jgi:hypothetical protein
MHITEIDGKELVKYNFLFVPFLAGIKTFAVTKLARLLYEKVDIDPLLRNIRAGIDWNTADDFIGRHLDEALVRRTAEEFFAKYLSDIFQNRPDTTILMSLKNWNEFEYRRLERVLGGWVYENFYLLMIKMDAIKGSYTNIKG